MLQKFIFSKPVRQFAGVVVLIWIIFRLSQTYPRVFAAIGFVFSILILVGVLWVLRWLAQKLFIRGEGRAIWSGSKPIIRRTTVRRIGARAVDFGVLAPPLVVATATIPTTTPSQIRYGFLLLSVSYFGVANYVAGTTVGKSVFGLEVASTAQNRISLVQSLVREGVATLSLLILPVAGYIVLKHKAALQMGDIVADTKVVDTHPKGVAGLQRFGDQVLSAINVGPIARSGGSSAGSSSGTPTKPQSPSGSATQTKIQNKSTTQSQGQNATKIQSGSGTASETASGSGTPRNSTQQPTSTSQSASTSGRGVTAPAGDESTETNLFNRESDNNTDADSDTICPNCDKSISGGANFCPTCKEEL